MSRTLMRRLSIVTPLVVFTLYAVCDQTHSPATLLNYVHVHVMNSFLATL